MERDEAARLAALTQGEVLTAVSQISAAVGTMDHVTQQNAAMVEQTSAASRNLASDVNALAEQSARFDTRASRVATSARRRPRMATAA